MPVKWCCAAFQGHYQNAGERTFSVLVDQDSSQQPAFFLQHRALDPGDQLPSSVQVPVSVISDVQIRFCPWCGRSLARWYKLWIADLRKSTVRL